MAIQKIDLVQGDNLPDINFTITDDNENPVDLTGVTVNFYLSLNGSIINSGSSTCTIVSAEEGICKYQFNDADLENAGQIEGELEITFANGKTQTIPNRYVLQVREQIA